MLFSIPEPLFFMGVFIICVVMIISSCCCGRRILHNNHSWRDSGCEDNISDINFNTTYMVNFLSKIS
ncbi:hypothetical protein FDZ58_04290 [Ehrlichia ruminantium]|uniref:hypothetical protein n=1 Tax=Ehrlichia ruminantium TaxID=779 RepID=UPI0015DC6F5E|nr:hypothetical protein [Ehrlichia ruminantium]QLK50847.1 hypothetical protein FDZ68_04290 [Ehrlichia ruminantium]QLK51769.1 hypothetical protein FDZ66_04290 [Ehrlichia ruminantium]QLK53607.1 hypothetical protein FDZ64_04290 [Ehrlichia ruminantium]QLK59101.1 hypothetical protein FDZ58_04290 [Ehrlichia ruminantium]